MRGVSVGSQPGQPPDLNLSDVCKDPYNILSFFQSQIARFMVGLGPVYPMATLVWLSPVMAPRTSPERLPPRVLALSCTS